MCARAAAAIAVGALALTACGTGSTVVDKPKAATSAKAAPTKAKTATVGDTITLKGSDKGSKLDVTVTKIADPAKAGNEFTTPGAGKRFVGVQFQLVNTGTTAYRDSPSNGTGIGDTQGQQFQATIADITAGPSMSSDLHLKPGARALGWIVYEVPKASKAATVQFTMDSGFADQTGEWKLP
jgi:hypothetical protein